MKKLSILLSALLCGLCLFGGAACGTEEKSYSVYAPDGAPALALAQAISQEQADGNLFEYRVISAATVVAQVTGENPAADFCVLPVNAAGKLLGTGEQYKMLGTVTNGNMYFLTTGENPPITEENLSAALTGKTVGVVQLTNVPGLTFQAVLKEKKIPYTIGGEAQTDKVNLKAIQDAAAEVTPAGGCDYYLCPEPAASTKIAKTAQSPKPFHLAGDLQKLYGGEEGYPQAVLIVKSLLLEEDANAVKTLVSHFEKGAEFLRTASSEQVLSLLAEKRTQGLTPSFTAENLTAEVIKNCSVRFTKSADCKDSVNAFLEKLKEIDPQFTAPAQDAFFATV